MSKVLTFAENPLLKNAFFLWNLIQKSSSGYPVVGKWERLANKGGKRFYSQDSSKNIVTSPLGNVDVPNILFHEFVTENWGLWERKTAVECVKTGRKYTYKNMLQYARTLAAIFQNKFNLSKGDILAMVLPNCPEYPLIILACSLSGVVWTTVNPSYTVDEIQRQLEDCSAKLIITDATAYDKCFSTVQSMKASFPILVVKHTPDDEIPQGGVDVLELFNSSDSGPFTPPDSRPDDMLVLPYSSGTTGGPKGVILSHKMIITNLKQLSHPETILMNPTTRFRQDTIFAVLPMFHIFGMVVCTFFPLREGCRLIILPSFQPVLFIETLYIKKVRIMYAVPPLLRILGHKKVRSRYLKHLQYIVNGASTFDLRDVHTIMEKAEQIKIVQGYGMTETSPVLAHTNPNRMQKLTSIGIPVASTKLKVVNPETGEILSTGKEGELCAWGPQVMKSYLNRPENTKNAFDKDGWFKTGDMAYYDDDKDFFIVSRLKELIKVKGFQVSPSELEEVLRSHPKIQDAVVVGVPDPNHGEVPRAFIILHKDVQMTEQEVKDFFEKKLSHYKQLRGGVRFVNKFPTNKIGKVLRKELQKMP